MEIIARIKKAIEGEPLISRRGLSREVCEWLGWRSANGKLQEMSCRKALQVLQSHGKIQLPEQTKSYGFQRDKSEKGHRLSCVKIINCRLAEVGKIEIEPVSSRYSKRSREWNELLDAYHYLGRGPLCGAQIRYLVRSEVYGYIGGLSFSGATRKLKARDVWIGWSEGARRQKFTEGGMQ